MCQALPCWVVITAVACLTTSLLAVSGGTDAATVQFTASGKVLKGAPVAEEWNLVGFVGDSVEIPDGKHQMGIDGPKGYTLRFVLTAAGSQIDVSELKVLPPNCQPELYVDWPAPRVQPKSKFKNVTAIMIADPRFGESTGRRPCSLPAMMGCKEQKVILKVTSQPAGAEIWIDGKKQQYQTNVTLSVPFCPRFKQPVRVLIRRDNAVNCMRNITPAQDATVAVSCRLRKPGL